MSAETVGQVRKALLAALAGQDIANGRAWRVTPMLASVVINMYGASHAYVSIEIDDAATPYTVRLHERSDGPIWPVTAAVRYTLPDAAAYRHECSWRRVARPNPGSS